MPAHTENTESCPPVSDKLSWGMCLSDLKRFYKSAPLGQVEDTLVYDWSPHVTFLAKLSDTPKVYYTFRVGYLVDILYVISQQPNDLNELGSDFQLINSLIERKYGTGYDVSLPPRGSGEQKYGSDDREKLRELIKTPCGNFVIKGFLCTYWETAGTTIIHAAVKVNSFYYNQFINFIPRTGQGQSPNNNSFESLLEQE